MHPSSVRTVALAMGFVFLAGSAALAEGKTGATVIPNADCERKKITTCKEEFQLDGKGGTTKTWVCTTTQGKCITTLQTPTGGSQADAIFNSNRAMTAARRFGGKPHP